MIRFLVSLLLFGALAVFVLIWFGLIEITPEGARTLEDAQGAVDGALDAAGTAIEDATSGAAD